MDVDEVDAVSAKAGVIAMPTFQTYKRQQKVKEVTGASKDALEKMVQEEC